MMSNLSSFVQWLALGKHHMLDSRHLGNNQPIFLACDDFVRMFDCSFPACAFLFLFFFFLLSGDWIAHTNSTLLGQDQSTVAQRAETTVAECSLINEIIS